MAVRGSGIGASVTALGLTSTRSGAADTVYGMSSGQTPTRVQAHHVLMVLVVVEFLALLWLRHAFRHHQGG